MSIPHRRWWVSATRLTSRGSWSREARIPPRRVSPLAVLLASVRCPLIEGLRNETVAKDKRIRKLLPREITPFDIAARAALDG
jgi:hypothetical protein